MTCGEEFDTQALLCTGLDAGPKQIISWFVRNGKMEATFQEVRQRLDFETQRQWVREGYPAHRYGVIGIVLSVVTLLAHLFPPRPPIHGEGQS